MVGGEGIEPPVFLKYEILSLARFSLASPTAHLKFGVSIATRTLKTSFEDLYDIQFHHRDIKFGIHIPTRTGNVSLED